MSAATAGQSTEQNLRPPWKPGQSGNPGGLPKGVRQLMGTIHLAFGGKVLTALQKLYSMGMDERHYMATDPAGDPIAVPLVDAKTRSACLMGFVDRVARLTGLEALAKPKETAPDEPTGDEGELLERVADALVKRPEGRAALEAKLVALKGGKEG